METNNNRKTRMNEPKISEDTNYQLKKFNMDKVEELETAIAPGGFGFGCGCKGIFGAFCG